MFKQFGKVVLSAIVASSLMMGASISAFASSAAPNAVLSKASFSDIQAISDSTIHPDGFKKWITVQAMKGVAKGLRAGGHIVDKIASELGGKEARYFTQHIDTIADALDDLIARGDVVEVSGGYSAQS